MNELVKFAGVRSGEAKQVKDKNRNHSKYKENKKIKKIQKVGKENGVIQK